MSRNSFRSEADAYRFLNACVGYFAAIVVASLLGGRSAGLAVFVGLSLIGITWLLRRGQVSRPVPQVLRRLGGPEERRVLVIANETVTGEQLREEIRRAAAGYRAQVLIVCPALNSQLRHWASDEDAARAAARERLDESLGRLRGVGIEASGEIGDSDPLQAIEDALRVFGADEIIISTHPKGRSNWLERGVVSSARERYALPITHLAGPYPPSEPSESPARSATETTGASTQLQR
jgi:hypothetical protein